MTLRSEKINWIFLLAISCCLFISCRQIEVFENSATIPDYKWDNKYKASGTFTITDTIASYNIYIVLRHKDSYQYNNIWLNVGWQGPGDTMFFQKVELKLAANDATGWEGTGMDDIWELRRLIFGQPRRFIKTGKYSFSISQAMRDNPLPGIMNVGLRVEKAQ